MELEQIKTVLRVMNMTAGYGRVYVCEPSSSGDLGIRTYGIEATYRFYLVPDDSALLGEKGVITA